MNSQHQSAIIQLQEFLPNEMLRLINEYLHNPLENTMKKVINDIQNKNYELEKTSWLEYDTIKHHFLLYLCINLYTL